MLKSLLDAVMKRRARRLLDHVAEWLPNDGSVLDLGSGTGHFSALLERELGLDVVTADVSDMHVVGRPPVLIADGVLPFDKETFSAALLLFMLAYPNDPAGVLKEAARVTRGPIIVRADPVFGRFRLRVASRPGIPLDDRRLLRLEAHRLRPTGREVHHAYPALLHRPSASAGSPGRRAPDPGAARAAGSTRPLPCGGRMDPGTQWLIVVSRSLSRRTTRRR